MARTRNLKPSFFTNETLAELPPLTRLFFQGLWTQADREGRVEDRPRRLKAEILPYDECDPEDLLVQLESSGFIHRYAVENNRCIWIPTFVKHQHPHPKELPSVIPPPPSRGKTRLVHGKKRPVLVETLSSKALPSYPSIPSSPSHMLEHSKDSSNGSSSGKPDPPAPVESRAAQARRVFTHWQEVFNHNRAIFGAKRQRAVEARLKQGFTVERLKQAVDGCRKSAYHQGENKDHQVYDDLELICRDEKHVEQFIGYLERREPLDVYEAAYRKAGLQDGIPETEIGSLYNRKPS